MSINDNNNCLICLEEGKLIEYNHCGNYYVHQKCLKKWKSNDCFICRKKLTESYDEECCDTSEITNISNDIRIVYEYPILRNNKSMVCILFGTLFIAGCTSYIFLKIANFRQMYKIT